MCVKMNDYNAWSEYHFVYHVVEHNCYRYHLGIACLCHAILFSVYACVFTCMSVILLCVCVYMHYVLLLSWVGCREFTNQWVSVVRRNHVMSMEASCLVMERYCLDYKHLVAMHLWNWSIQFKAAHGACQAERYICS